MATGLTEYRSVLRSVVFYHTVEPSEAGFYTIVSVYGGRHQGPLLTELGRGGGRDVRASDREVRSTTATLEPSQASSETTVRKAGR